MQATFQTIPDFGAEAIYNRKTFCDSKEKTLAQALSEMYQSPKS